MTDTTANVTEARHLEGRDLQRYIARGRRLHAEAVGGGVAALFRLPLELFRRVAGGVRSPLWRAPHTGNCLNC